MSQTIVHSPIREAELFLGEEAQHLRSHDNLYQAYTQEKENPLSLYIGQDVATLLASPPIQGQIASKLHSSPNLVQIKVTPQKELYVAKTGTTDFQKIDFEEDSTPPEVAAIAEKSQQLYMQMRPSLNPVRAEDQHPRPREWSHGYPTHVSGSDTAQLHERIHSLENQLATERLRGDMREMRDDIRENRTLLLDLLRSRGAGSPTTDREIDTLRRQLERATRQVDRLIDQARDRGLSHSAEMHDLLRENTHLRRVCSESQEDLRDLEIENAHSRRTYEEAQGELGELHEALGSDTTQEALQNLRRLERTIRALKERERMLQEALEADLPEDMLAKIFELTESTVELNGANIALRRQLHQAEEALDRLQGDKQQTDREIGRLKHTVSDLNLQFRHDQQAIHRLIGEVKALKASGGENEEQIERLTGQLKEFHDRLYPRDHETAVVALDGMIDRLDALNSLEGSLQDILDAEGPEDIIQKVLAIRQDYGELGGHLDRALRSIETLQRQLEDAESARGEFEESVHSLRSELQSEKRTTSSLREELVQEKEEIARLSLALRKEEEKSAALLLEKGQAEDRLRLATTKVERLGEQLNDVTEQLRVSKKGLEDLGTEKIQLEDALVLATRERDRFSSDLDEVAARLRTSEEAGETLKGEVTTLGRRIGDLERKNATLLKQRDRAQEALASLKATHQQTQGRLLQVETELLGERDNVLRAEAQSDTLRREFSAEKRELQGQIHDLTAAVGEGELALEGLTRKLEGSQEDLEANQRELDRLEKDLKAAQASAQHLDGEARKLEGNYREALEANQALQTQHRSREVALLEEIQLKEASISHSEEEFARMSKTAHEQGEQLLSLKSELERGRTELASLRSEHRQTLDLLQSEQKKGRALQAKLDHVNNASREQLRELEALQEEHQQLLDENQALSSAHKTLQKEKKQLEEHLQLSEREVLRLTEAARSLEDASREQEVILNAQKQEIADLAMQLARVKRESDAQTAAYKKQVAELSERLTPHQAEQLRAELASEKRAVAKLTEELRREKEKATAALEEVSRREPPQDTKARNETIARLEKALREASSRSEELDSQLSMERAQRLESQSQQSNEIVRLQKQLEKLHASLESAERCVEERLSPESERELRAELQARNETVRDLSASLSEATREKDLVESEVQSLRKALKDRGSLSEGEIETLRKQLREAEGAALRASQNATESERRFQEADKRRLQLQDEVLLFKKLNLQLQADADNAVALKQTLAEIAVAVGTSEGTSSLPDIIRQKVAKLQEMHDLLETLSDQIIDPMSLARQLDQVELSMLPQALTDKLKEIQQLKEEHAEAIAQLSKKDEEIFLLRESLGKSRDSLSGYTKQQNKLRQRESDLEVLTRSAESTKLAHQEGVQALRKEIAQLSATVDERQSVVEEFYNRMLSAEDQRDAAVKQRDTARLAVSEKDVMIKELSSRIDELEEESFSLRKEVERRGKIIKTQLAELHEQRERLEEQDPVLEDQCLEIAKLERVNRARRTRLEENEKEIGELRHEAGELQQGNDRLKDALERISAVLKVPFTIKKPEELAASLEGRIKEIQSSRSQLQEAFDTHIQYLGVAKSTIEGQEEEIEELSRAAITEREDFKRRMQLLDEEVHNLKLPLERAYKQVARCETDLDCVRSPDETPPGTTQGVEFTPVQKGIQQAIHAGEVMGVLGAALGEDPFSLQLTAKDDHLLEVTKNHQDYLSLSSKFEQMRALAEETAKEKGIGLPAAYELIREKYYGRHTQQVSSQITKINSSPEKLDNLSLFVGFFKVISGISGTVRTHEFARLTAVRRILDRLDPKTDAEKIAGLKVQAEELTRVLIKNLMKSIYETTKTGSGETQYSNFGLHLIMWADILNNLDASLYVDDDRTKPLKTKDAESIRRTVRQLNVQFHHLMVSTHHQTSPDVWVPNCISV